jgi:hypothetical protein
VKTISIDNVKWGGKKTSGFGQGNGFLEGRGEKTIWRVFSFIYIPQMRLPLAMELPAACNSSKESSLANLKFISSEN